MKIVIVGGGKVGYAIAGEVSGEGHDVTIIDHNPANYERLSLGLDCMTILGDGNSLEALRAANAGESDLLIAATPNDEVNILCCFLARKLGCPNTIARLRRWEYKQEMDLLQEDLGLSMMVTPDRAAAQEIFRLLQFPGFLKRESFAKSRVEMVAFEVKPDSVLHGKKLMELQRVLRQKILVCAVQRNGEAIIPSGSFELHSGDEIYVTAPATELSRLMVNVGLRKTRMRDVMIIGAGRMGISLAGMLLKSGTRVKLAPKSDCHMLVNRNWRSGDRDIAVIGGIWDLDNASQSPNPHQGRHCWTRPARRRPVLEAVGQEIRSWLFRHR